MITLEHDSLSFRFPDVHAEAVLGIELQRTLRIPDDGRSYPLPPGLGRFPLRHLDDFAARLPQQMTKRGGVMTPIAQAEALWLNFTSPLGYPFAVKVATGKINAVSGDDWAPGLNRDPQDYCVVPGQPWLDGYNVAKGEIRQFVAMPLGGGYTVEEQLTGAAENGGIQLLAMPMKAERWEKILAERRRKARARTDEDGFGMVYAASSPMPAAPMQMGLAPGGRMKQEIFDDRYGLDAWDQRHASRVFVTLLNTEQWLAVTGERPPGRPPTSKDYTAAGLPWFDWYDADAKALEGAEKLGGLKSANEIAKEKGEMPPLDDPFSGVLLVSGGRLLGGGGRPVREFT